MADLFQIVTIEDGSKDNAAILKVFNDIMEGSLVNDIKLLNYYRELPVSFSAEILNVSQDRIEMKVHQNQAVVMKHEKQTIVRTSHLPKGYGAHAFVAMSNIDRCRTILTRFAYVQIKADRRGAVRVQLDERVDISFTSPVGTISGRLHDISITGVSIKSSQPLDFEPNTSGEIACMLLNGSLKVSAKTIKSFPLEDDFIHIFALEEDGKAEALISQFIFVKQVEIIRELKEQFE